jgi:hypothetical protein
LPALGATSPLNSNSRLAPKGRQKKRRLLQSTIGALLKMLATDLSQDLNITQALSPAHRKELLEKRGPYESWIKVNCRSVSADEATQRLGYTAKGAGILLEGAGIQIQFKLGKQLLKFEVPEPEKKVGGDKKPKTPIDRSIRVLHIQSIKKN